MKLSILIIFALITSISYSQISFNTGSRELDANLTIINKEGNNDFKSFKRDLSIDYNVPEPKLESMRVSLGLIPGEIYLALEIARNSPSSLDEVLKIYQKNKSQGWGNIAKQAGIKPGSAAFHQLKNNAKGKKDKGKKKPTHVKIKPAKHGKSKGNPHKGRK